MNTDEPFLCLSVFICVYLWPIMLFSAIDNARYRDDCFTPSEEAEVCEWNGYSLTSG